MYTTKDSETKRERGTTMNGTQIGKTEWAMKRKKKKTSVEVEEYAHR
jgi:hypothetical protein